METRTNFLENDKVKLYWDFSIQTEKRIEHDKPDIAMLSNKQKMCLVDFAFPFDTRKNNSNTLSETLNLIYTPTTAYMFQIKFS